MLLLKLAGDGVLVAEDEVNLVGSTALVGAKHDNVRRGVGELFAVKGFVLLKEFQVGTTALEAIYDIVSILRLLDQLIENHSLWSLTSY